MQSLIIEKTYSTPYVHFDADTGVLKIIGESFPENVAKFYTPILDWLRQYLSTASQVTMEFEIVYFNSSSSKVFMTLFDVLEQAFIGGKDVQVKWRCSKENDTAIECGEEFKEDLHSLPFIIELF